MNWKNYIALDITLHSILCVQMFFWLYIQDEIFTFLLHEKEIFFIKTNKPEASASGLNLYCNY